MKPALPVVLLVAVGGVTGQDKPAFRTDTRLVDVPVIVLDRKTQQPVRGLGADDFELLENGRPQGFELLTYESPARSPAESSAALPANLFANRRPQGERGTLVTFLIDGWNARFEETYYAAKAVAEVIDTDVSGAQWGVYLHTPFGLRIVHDYSGDGASVRKRVQEMRSAGGVDIGFGEGSTHNGDPQVISRLRTEGILHEMRRITATLSTLRAIAVHLQGVPGRKSVVWLTAGFQLEHLIKREPHLWYWTLNVLNEASVAVYTIDSAGVRTARVRALAEAPTERSPMLRGGGSAGWQNADLMYGISESTGGRAYRGSNALAKAVRAALRDSEVFYRLTYRPTHGLWKGQTVRLKVRVKRSGVEVRHRLSYVARNPEPLDVEDRARVLSDAVISPLEATEISLLASLKPPDADPPERILLLTAEAGAVSLDERDNLFHGQFDIRCVQKAADGRTLEDFTDEVALNLKPADAERTRSEGFNYRRTIKPHAEAVTLVVAFCDRATGRLGSIHIPLP